MTKTPPDPPPRHRYSLRTFLSLRTVNANPSFLKQQAALLGPIYRPEPITTRPCLPSTSRHRYSPDHILSLRPPRLPSPVSHSPSPPNLPPSSPPLSSHPSSSLPSLPRPIPRSNFTHTSDDRRLPLSGSPPPEFRRRSPSPPASSSMSSSPPPGFEPSFSSKPVSKHAAKAALCREREAMYRSRICKGPDLNRNFASRLAYHALKPEQSPPAFPPPPLRTPSRPVLHRSRSPSPDLSRRRDATTEAFGVSSKLRAGQNGKSSIQPEGSRPPVVSYNISGVVSFEDFSKRLAAEVASDDLLKSKARSRLISAVDNNPVLEENIYLNKDDNVEERQREQSPTPDQEAVDELAKWFGRISAITDDDNLKQQGEDPESSFMPLEEVERQMTELKESSPEDSKEELDSNVLSFFDTIKSQAMGEHTDVMLENGDVHGPLYSEGLSSGMENYFHSKYVARETTNTTKNEEGKEQLSTDEVEEYSGVIRNGKQPVYNMTRMEAENRNGVPPDGAYKELAPLASAQSPTEVQQGSESLELERWFNSLALQSELES